IGTYADNADDSMVINKTLSAQAILVTDSDYFDYNRKDLASDGELNLYINGDAAFENGDYDDLANVTLFAGDQVELFENDDKEVDTIAVIRYSLAKIDTIEDNLSSTYTNKGASYAIDLEDLNESSVGSGTYYDVYDGDSSKELPGFNAETYEEGTVLAVALNNDGDVFASHVAKTAEGTITTYNSGSKAYVTIDSANYPLHAVVFTSSQSPALDEENRKSLAFNMDDSIYTVYTDANGYVVGIDETESVKIEDVYYVSGILKDTSRYTTYYAQAVSVSDGTITEFKLDPTDTGFGGTPATLIGGGNFAKIQGLYTFDKDGSNYDAKPYTSASDNTYYVFGAPTKANATDTNMADKLARDDTSMKLTGVSRTLYLNDRTNYVKVEDDQADIDVSFVTGGTSVANTWTSGGTTYGTDAIVIATKTGNNYVASYVVLVSDKFNNAGSDDVVFVHERSSSSVSYTDADGESQSGWATELWFLDGSGNKETVTVTTRVDAGFYTWELNDDGVYELSNGKTYNALTLAADYKDETGHAGFTASGNDIDLTAGVTLDSIYNNGLTVKNVYSTHDADDVAFAENVIIADDRSKAVRDNDPYTSAITNASQLKSAIDKANSDVQAIVYYDDEEVIMVYVLKMVATADSNVAEINSVTLNGDEVSVYTTSAAAAAKPITVPVSSTMTVAADGLGNMTYKLQRDYTSGDFSGNTINQGSSQFSGTANKVDVIEVTATSGDGSKTVSRYFAVKTAVDYTISNVGMTATTGTATVTFDVATALTASHKIQVKLYSKTYEGTLAADSGAVAASAATSQSVTGLTVPVTGTYFGTITVYDTDGTTVLYTAEIADQLLSAT
ncbi:hypothetical protein ACEVJK_12655, partial [Flintibacter sp. P01028]|uniref:hypothetical protein n=1 Tax=Flintibacter sp. P01028 TaxID=3342382 RepID=UPI0035B60E0C